MAISYKNIIYSLVILFCVIPSTILSQTIDQKIEELKVLVSQSRHTEAYPLAEEIEQDLIQAGEGKSEKMALVLEKKAWAKTYTLNFSEAITILNKLEELCKQKNYTEVLFDTYILKFRALHLSGDQSNGYLYLEKAKQLSAAYHPDLYPECLHKTAAYFWENRQLDSALYYASEAIKHTSLDSNTFVWSSSNQLIGIVLEAQDTLLTDAIAHFKLATKGYKKLQDSMNVSSNYLSTAMAYYSMENYQLALNYMDSSEMFMSPQKEKEHVFYLGAWYERKAIILNAAQMHDSAWVCINKAHEYSKKAEEEARKTEALEIEEKYQNEQNTARIEEQERQLQQEAQQRFWLIVITSFIILLVIIITSLYARLRKAKKEVETQAALISAKNKDLSISLDQQKLLLGEVHHRVKNNLQIIISLLELQFEDFEQEELRKNIDAMSNRIYSIAAIHEMMYKEDGTQSFDLEHYIKTLCTHIAISSNPDDRPSFDLNLPNEVFNLETLIPLGIMLNELLTNSFKYARIPNQKLKISVRIQENNDGYLLYYKDNGKGLPEGKLKQKEGSLGSYLLTNMSRQLRGKMKCYNDNGATFEIFFKEKNKR